MASGAGQSPRRAGWRSKLDRAALFAYGRRLLHPQLLFRRDGTFSVGLDVLVWRCAVCVFQGFRLSAPQNAKFILASQGRTVTGKKLARQTRKNRPPARLCTSLVSNFNSIILSFCAETDHHPGAEGGFRARSHEGRLSAPRPLNRAQTRVGHLACAAARPATGTTSTPRFGPSGAPEQC